MPQGDFYSGLSLKDQLRSFAEHHFDEETRHISAYEYEMLCRVIAAMPDDEDSEAEE